MEHERIPPRTPNMNAHIESFHRLLQDECLVRYDFETYSEAYEAVTEFIPAFAICRRLSFMRKTRQNRFRSEKFVYNFKNEISMSKRELVSKLRGLIRELRLFISFAGWFVTLRACVLMWFSPSRRTSRRDQEFSLILV
ncbi:integrase core domain-containing protein [Paenibacillus sp. RC254]|uniref:integrase core domain-containing protein n=1 Tax=Paenibacillus sp. RC254 TaxID=3156246 RepID=UPI0038513E18